MMPASIRIAKLRNTVKPYAWGSETHISQLLGVSNEKGEPQAELWMGAHPSTPSKVVFGERQFPLIDIIANDPDRMLGPKAYAAFKRLPFLFKALAAGEPLSIQAHPTLEEARAGFKREDQQFIARDAFNRSYKDDNHKPEVICALTPFWALRGFRPIPDIVAHLGKIAAPEIPALLELLGQSPAREALRAFYGRLMHLEAKGKQRLLEGALAVSSSDPGGPEWNWIPRLAEKYPGDIGALSPLYLNLVCLQPGQAMFLPAGVLHAYLEGFGIELMANSDNVLRGGLTPKFMDMDELLRILTFAPEKPRLLAAEPVSPVESVYRADTDEFRLSVIRLADGAIHEESLACFRILLCVHGTGEITDTETGDRIPIEKGESCMVPFCVPSFSLKGKGVFYKAGVPAQR